MANGAAFAHAVNCAKANPGLGIGCHVVLVDGSPVSASPKIASLLLPDGRFRPSPGRFLFDLHRGAISREAIRLEATAQIQKLQEAGLRVTHVDTHKHTHIFPRVARPLLEAAAQCGVRAIRNPFEEPWSARTGRTAPLRRLQVALLLQLRRGFLRLTNEFSFQTTQGALGVAATGHLDTPALRSLLRSLPPGVWELVCHPGYRDSALDAIATRLRSSRETERVALAGEIPAALDAARIRLISYADLNGRG